VAIPTQPSAAAILSPDDMGLLKRLELTQRRRAQGHRPGQRRSPRTARSPELADFRPYVAGDDIRQIDWRAYGRLERLMLKLYVAEEESALNVVVDTSDSMTTGSPPKLGAARRLAAAVAMLGLGALDRVAVGVLDRDPRPTPHLRLAHGASRLLGHLSELQPGGRAGPEELPRLGWLRPGITVVISDFLVEGSWASALAALAKRGQETVLWQVLAPDEERPPHSGDLRLRDAESDTLREITITPRVIRGYVEALAALRAKLTKEATAAGGRFLHTSSADSLEAAMATAIGAGVVRRA
jgi:uncharacterized protein (DUF58 family)